MDEILSLPERLDADLDLRGRGICVAFVDSGFFAHPDLVMPRRRLRAFADATRPRPVLTDFLDPRPAAWHGTMTACAAVGSGHTSGGRYRGLASEADVVLIQAAGADGNIDGALVASAIRFPLRYPKLGIRVLSVSLGVEPDDPYAEDVDKAVADVVASGVVVVAAAGNDPRVPPQPPASARDAITVGGSDDQNTRDAGDDRIWPSSGGHRPGGVVKPDLVAPACWLPAPMIPGTRTAREAAALHALREVLDEAAIAASFHPPAETNTEADGSLQALIAAVTMRIERGKFVSSQHQHVDGTSFAAPITASVVAQMLEVHPKLTPKHVRDGLLSTAIPLPHVSRDVQGAGVLAPRAAVAWARARR